MKIEKETVNHIAKLANLELGEQEVEMFTRQLGDILTYVEKLNEVHQPAEPFSFNRYLPSLTRKDEVDASIPVEETLQNAPASVKRFFKVPRILP